MTTKVVIFDIDGTLADVSHRRHHVIGGRNWEAFFAEMVDDPCIESVQWLAHKIASDVPIILCSGRPEKYRGVTEEWLKHFNIEYKILYMRPDDDMRQDYIVKSQMLDAILEDGFEPILVVDDRPSVVSMWRERGLTCLQCADWDEPMTCDPGLVTLMVGPSGAGKSTFLSGDRAKEYGIHPSHVLSSDQIRADLCGDFKDQTKNDAVYAALHAQAKTRIKHGLPVVIDATNLRRKDRLACVALADDAAVRYLVLNRSMEEKRRDGGWRLGLPIDLIAKHEQIFNSQIKEILAGDNLPNISVVDMRAP